jgi:hypothetical protein
LIPLMLLPGMMCSAQLFRHQIAQFSCERAVQFSPLLGHADVSSFAAEVLQNAPGEFALCGLSMGGALPWRCNDRHLCVYVDLRYLTLIR